MATLTAKRKANKAMARKRAAEEALTKDKAAAAERATVEKSSENVLEGWSSIVGRLCAQIKINDMEDERIKAFRTNLEEMEEKLRGRVSEMGPTNHEGKKIKGILKHFTNLLSLCEFDPFSLPLIS